MPKKISLDNLDALCRGATFLGSGGGGDPQFLYPLIKNALTNFGPVSLIDIDNLADEAWIFAIEMVGASIPGAVLAKELLISPIFDFAKKTLGINPAALMPVEIGGSNALTPFSIAGQEQLPVVDGDLLGRAFPEISLISTNLHGIMPHKAIIGNPLTGEAHVIEAHTYEELEKKARAIAAKSEITTAILLPIILSKKDAQKSVIKNTVSRALSIGETVFLDELIKAADGNRICAGIIQAWNYQQKGGFLVGEIVVIDEQQKPYVIAVKNEYLSLMMPDGQKIVAPEIITLLDKKTLTPIVSSKIALNQEIILLTAPGPKEWYSERGVWLIEQGCFKNG